MKGLTPVPRDQYYSIRHFARYTDPGDVLGLAEAQGEGLLASAYVAPGDQRLSVVLLNTSKKAMDAAVDGGSFTGAKTQAFVTSYRPGSTRRWVEAPLVDGKLRLPARAVATVVYNREGCPHRQRFSAPRTGAPCRAGRRGPGAR